VRPAAPATVGPRALTVSHWEADGTEPVLDTTVAGVLQAAAAQSPDTVALVRGVADPAHRRRWSYAELAAAQAQAAAALASSFAEGERVAVWAPSRWESLVLTYAAAAARLVLVPLHPALRPDEVRYALDHCQAAGVFHAEEYRGVPLGTTLAAVATQLPALRSVTSLDDWDEFCAAGAGHDAARPPPDPDDVAQIVYTSGTTGTPKGAMLTHRGMTNAARFGARRFGIEPGDVYIDTMPLFHVGGQVVALQICQSRATAVLLEAFDPGLVLELVETERATLTAGVPTMLLALIEHGDFTRRDLSSLRSVSSGGSVVPPELVRHIEAALGVRAAIVFGQTEASGFISQTRLDDGADDKARTLGAPLPGVDARVVGPLTRAVVPVGEVGELEVRGPNVMRGYHRDPAASAAAIDTDGWLRTGDLVTMDRRGYLCFAGRSKEVIVTGGENVYPAEVEAALVAHPDVALAAVIGLPDARWGETVGAVLQPVAGAAPSAAQMARWARDRLAAYKVPRRWAVVPGLPLTASGKIQKYRLAEDLFPPGAVDDEDGS